MTPVRRLSRVLLLAVLAVAVLGRPAAATTKVRNSGCKITITLKIEVFGAAANKAIAKKIKKDIDGCFPKKYKFKDWCPVHLNTSVVVRRGNKPRKGYHHIEIIADPNDDDVGGTFTSHCDAVGTPDGKTETGGAWDDHEAKNTYAHEAGHLMGLEDEYNEGRDANGKRTSTPKPGHANDKMATLSGMYQPSGIDAIIMKAGVKCPDHCCKNKTRTVPTTTTSTTLPAAGFVCSGSFTATIGIPNEADFVFSCQEQTPIALGSFALQVPNRQVTDFIHPPGFSCQPGTVTSPQDALVCTGNVPGNQDLSGRIQTQPAPLGKLGGQLFLFQGSTRYGPFTITGP